MTEQLAPCPVCNSDMEIPDSYNGTPTCSNFTCGYGTAFIPEHNELARVAEIGREVEADAARYGVTAERLWSALKSCVSAADLRMVLEESK